MQWLAYLPVVVAAVVATRVVSAARAPRQILVPVRRDRRRRSS
jgi:hypothetical protein